MLLKRLKSLCSKVLERLHALNDLIIYRRSLTSYKRFSANLSVPDKGALLIISGRGMNVLWAQIWTILSLPIRTYGYRGLVLTTHRQWLLNRYFKLLYLELVFLDDYFVDESIPDEIRLAVQAANSLDDYKSINYKNVPVGQISLSTYSRHFGTGLIDFNDPTVITNVREWIGRICGYIELAENIYSARQVRILFFTEVFMEEYGAFYYAALNSKLNIIRFAGTVRDDAYIMQHLSYANDRIHHSSIDKTTWKRIREGHNDEIIESELMQNFKDRYGEKWHRSKRNHPNTQIIDVETARNQLKLQPGRKVAIVYSHILYDTLFFFGTDLFKDYSEWLVETVRAAVANPHVDWLIKVHPSNLWRGELNSLLKGRYEEERLIQDRIGALPPHVRIVAADTQINPFTWFQLADYGITVRGTSGLEMAALGKTVITAGTGRYEGNGFTIDPPSAAQYLDILRHLHELPALTQEQVCLANRYAHAIFVLKPYTLTSLVPRLRSGRKVVYASDDMIYTPTPLIGGILPADLSRFGEWALALDERDLLSGRNVVPNGDAGKLV